VVHALRTVLAVLGTAAGLNAQQRADLHGIRVEVLPVHALRLEHQVLERQVKQCLYLGTGPVMA
jgi:hypothetical protein